MPDGSSLERVPGKAISSPCEATPKAAGICHRCQYLGVRLTIPIMNAIATVLSHKVYPPICRPTSVNLVRFGG